MRLDHLLSKEHLTLRSPEPSSKAHVLRWELMGGTFDMVRRMKLSLSTPLAVGTGRVSDVAPARCWVLRDRMRVFGLVSVPLGLLLFPLWGRREGYRPYFENYTVDASILQPASVGCTR